MSLFVPEPQPAQWRLHDKPACKRRQTDRLKARTVAAVNVCVNPSHAKRRLVLAQQLCDALGHLGTLQGNTTQGGTNKHGSVEDWAATVAMLVWGDRHACRPRTLSALLEPTLTLSMRQKPLDSSLSTFLSGTSAYSSPSSPSSSSVPAVSPFPRSFFLPS